MIKVAIFKNKHFKNRLFYHSATRFVKEDIRKLVLHVLFRYIRSINMISNQPVKCSSVAQESDCITFQKITMILSVKKATLKTFTIKAKL